MQTQPFIYPIAVPLTLTALKNVGMTSRRTLWHLQLARKTLIGHAEMNRQIGHTPIRLPDASCKLMDVQAKLEVVCDAVPVRLLLLASMAVVQVGHPQDAPLVESPLCHLIAERPVPSLAEPGSQHSSYLMSAKDW
jgi:hypothetical protein